MRESFARHWLVLIIAVSTPSVFVATMVIASSGGSDTATVPGAVSLESEPVAPAPGATTPAPDEPLATGRDHVLDLTTGVATPLPPIITGSVGRAVKAASGSLSPRYAAAPGGSWLAYVGIGGEGNVQIFIASVTGHGIRQMTHDPVGARSPAWSPDGKSIAYLGYGRGDVRNLFVLELRAGKPRQVTRAAHGLWETQFTPDGSSLLYTGGSESAPVLRTVPVTGGKSTLLIGASGGLNDAGNGSLSPDGSLITYQASGTPPSGGHCGPCRLVANSDGTNKRVIPECFVSNPAGTWSPDGSRIVCSDGDGDAVMVVDVATGAARPVADGRSAIWLGADTLLVET
jgi:Tol biopolymer transport system component